MPDHTDLYLIGLSVPNEDGQSDDDDAQTTDAEAEAPGYALLVSYPLDAKG